MADDGVHVSAYPGDATGDGSYSGLDAQEIACVAVGLDGGFDAFRLLDPAILADLTGVGYGNGLDAALVARQVVGLPAPPISALPSTIPPIVRGGADPLVELPSSGLAVDPGGAVTVAVTIDHADGLESADLTLAYDPSRLDLSASGVRLSTAAAGFSPYVDLDPTRGLLRVTMYRTEAETSSAGGACPCSTSAPRPMPRPARRRSTSRRPSSTRAA